MNDVWSITDVVSKLRDKNMGFKEFYRFLSLYVGIRRNLGIFVDVE